MISREMTLSCVKDLSAALKIKDNGVILFGKSKMAYNQSNEAELGTVNKSAQVATMMTCNGDLTIKDEDLLKNNVVAGESFEIKNLKLGESTRDAMMTSAQGEMPQSSEVLISCAKDAAQSVISGQNGLQLLAGAKIVLNRDEALLRLKKLAGEKEIVVITCGLE